MRVKVPTYSHLFFLAGSVQSAEVLNDETIVVQDRRERRRAGIYNRLVGGNPEWDRQMCQVLHPELDLDKHERGCAGFDLSIEPHSCPFMSDVHEDKVSLCTCCKACEGLCCNEI